MRVVVVTAPSVSDVLTTAEAREHLRVEDDAEDALIGGYVAAAVEHLDGPGGWLGRALAPQTLELRLDAFCGSIELPWIELPCPPVSEVTSVKYIDGAGAEQTIDSGDYALHGDRIDLAWGKSWPSPRAEREAVRVRYVAGYEQLPAPIKAALLLMVGDLYANRETGVVGMVASAVKMSVPVENLLTPYRVWS